MADKVTKEMMIADILKLKPAAGDVLMNNGMHCLGCSIAHGETLEQASEAHGIDINKLIEEINKAK